MNISVIIPSYNEKETVKEVIDILEQRLKGSSDQYSILVVDGQSPDGTGEIVQQLCTVYPNLHLLSRPKSGIGRDYIAGMTYCLRNFAPEVLVEMDADLQHDPKDVERLVAEIHNGYDAVIGSRYIPGGSIPKEWGWYRKFLSFFGSFFARVMLGILSVHDMTSGFKATRVKGFMDQLDLDNLLSGKQAYKLHIIYELNKCGAKFKEVPIVFANRGYGESKIVRADLFEAFKVVLILGIKKRKTLFQIVFVGFIGLIFQVITNNLLLMSRYRLDIASLFGLKLQGIPTLFVNQLSANFFGWYAAVTSNFILNSLWTFQGETGGTNAVMRYFKFLVTSVGALLITFLVPFLGTALLGNSFVIYNLFFFLSLILVFAWNYFFYTHLIWRKKK